MAEIFLEERKLLKRFRSDYFPYYMINGGLNRLLSNLKTTNEHSKKEVNLLCHQLVKDYSPNKDKHGKIVSEGMNHEFQEILIKQNYNRDDSLLLFRYWQYDFQSSFTILMLICSGAYNTALREMRFVLESFVHAYCLDKEYFSLKIKEKFVKLQELKYEQKWRNKSKLFKENFAEFVGQDRSIELYDFYANLSEMVHASYGELQELREIVHKDESSGLLFGASNIFNEDKLKKCLTMFQSLHTHLIKILKEF